MWSVMLLGWNVLLEGKDVIFHSMEFMPVQNVLWRLSHAVLATASEE